MTTTTINCGAEPFHFPPRESLPMTYRADSSVCCHSIENIDGRDCYVFAEVNFEGREVRRIVREIKP
jgi:hypothetical protein